MRVCLIIKNCNCTILRSLEQNTTIGGQLLYSIVSAIVFASGTHQHKSVQVYTRPLPPESPSRLPPRPTPRGGHRALAELACLSTFSRALFHLWSCARVQLSSQPALLPACPSVSAAAPRVAPAAASFCGGCCCIPLLFHLPRPPPDILCLPLRVLTVP